MKSNLQPDPAPDVKPARDEKVLQPLWVMPSVWVHGAGLSGSTWDRFTRTLNEALTPDLPGHGSFPQVHPARVERFADLLEEGVPQGCVLVGHSLGGMVALELAARHPERIRALVLIEAVPTVRTSRLRVFGTSVALKCLQWVPPRLFVWLSTLGQTEETARHLKHQLSRHTRSSINAALEAALHYDGVPLLSGIKVPTLVVIGQKNRATHGGARLIAHTIPGAKLVSLPGGHMLHTDNPTQLRRVIDVFLKEVMARQ